MSILILAYQYISMAVVGVGIILTLHWMVKKFELLPSADPALVVRIRNLLMVVVTGWALLSIAIGATTTYQPRFNNDQVLNIRPKVETPIPPDEKPESDMGKVVREKSREVVNDIVK